MARSPLVVLEYPTYDDINTTRDTLKMLRKAIVRDTADLLAESAFFALIAAEKVLARLDQVPGLHLPLDADDEATA